MKQIISFFIVILLASCSTGKKISYEKMMEGAPAWVRQSPNSPAFYHGVGMASKATAPNDYREIARRNALSEMASGISVNISSNSVLNQYEFDNNYSEFYRENIRMSASQILEGYEQVEIWENDLQYWVYFRLSKEKYREIKQQRIDKALQTSRADFEQARTLSSRGSGAEAMRFYVKSLENIKDFLGEDLTTGIDGKTSNYSTVLMADLMDFIRGVRIVYPVTEIAYTRGVGPDRESLEAKVLDAAGKPLSGIPISLKYTYAPGRTDERTSDAGGSFRIRIEKFDAATRDQSISAALDLNKFVRDNSNDPVVRRLLQGIRITDYVLPLVMISPDFYLQSNELNLGAPLNVQRIKKQISGLLQNDGFGQAPNKAGADYILEITTETQQGNESGGKYSATLNATFTLKNKNNQVVYTEKLSGISGLGSSFDNAGEDAYRALEGRIRMNVYPAMYRKVFGR
jgi:hypothetical protein